MFSRPFEAQPVLHPSAQPFACRLRAVRSAADDAFPYQLESLWAGTQKCVCGAAEAEAEAESRAEAELWQLENGRS